MAHAFDPLTLGRKGVRAAPQPGGLKMMKAKDVVLETYKPKEPI